MLYANVDNERVGASPGERGTCPVCESEVIAKCGEINIWHWAHRALVSNCVGGEETEWHRHWKSKFPIEIVEVVRERNGQRRRADVLMPNGWALEFQNSPIDYATIEAREEFWDNRVFWIYNLRECADRVSLWDKRNFHTFCYRRPRRYTLYGSEKHIAWDFGGGNGVLVPKKIYHDRRATGWGNLYTHQEFLGLLKAWGRVALESFQPMMQN